MKKTRKLFTIKMLRKPLIFMLTAVMLIAALPVTTAEAKKLGKIPMAQGVDDLRERSFVCVELFNEDNPSGVDYPQRGYTWKEIYSLLYCKPGDTFTLVPDNEKFEQLNGGGWEIYGKVLWHTSDPDVATVNKNGKVTVKGEGYAVISAGIMVKGKTIYGKPFDDEEILFHHHIFSGPVLQLKKGNVKAVAKNAQAIYKRGRYPIVRAKGTPEETEELFNSFIKKYNKYGHTYRDANTGSEDLYYDDINAGSKNLYGTGNVTYWFGWHFAKDLFT